MRLALCVYLALSLVKKEATQVLPSLRGAPMRVPKGVIADTERAADPARSQAPEVARAHARLVQPPTRTLARPAGTTMAQTVRKEQIVVEQQQARRSLCPWSLARSRTQPHSCSLRHSGG